MIATKGLKIPKHVAIILDGNGRWAKERGMSRSKGHLEGFNNLKEVSTYILDKGVEVLSVYAFSTENFKRSKEEVDFLMNLFVKKFNEEGKYFNEKNVRVVFSGRRFAPLPKKVIDAMEKLEKDTINNTRGILNICINYGGHTELIDAAKKIANDAIDKKIVLDKLDEEMFSKYLYQELPPIDLLIRTSGENRISNFMLWQLSYAEFYFPKVYFPDFNSEQFDLALIEFSKRDRRYGNINYDEKTK